MSYTFFIVFYLTCLESRAVIQTLYTVKDIAAIISLDGTPDDLRKCMRQIRHWTNNDVLIPVGGKATGTGVSRVYDEDAIYKAAMAAELVRYGVTVEMLGGELFDEWMSMVMTAPQWAEAKDEFKDFMLQFIFDPDGQGSDSFKPLYEPELAISTKHVDKTRTRGASAIVVNVALICRRLRF
jgi:hypothetical protein